jgi:hypothetical protein
MTLAGRKAECRTGVLPSEHAFSESRKVCSLLCINVLLSPFT